jgi:leucokinin receptor
MDTALEFETMEDLSVTSSYLNISRPNGSNSQLFYVPVGLVVLLSVVYGSISIIAVIGNILVILVIATNRRMQTVTNFFIANLSIADVIIGCLGIPFQFQAALLQRWDLPDILCPVAPFVKELSVNVSVATLTVIAIDRFFAVVRPLKPGFSGCTAVIVMLIVWATSILSSLPTAVAFRVVWIEADDDEWKNDAGTKPFCYPKFPIIAGFDTHLLYALYLIIVQYFLPLVIISFAYCRIMYSLWIARTPGTAVDGRDKIINRNKKKVCHLSVCIDLDYYHGSCSSLYKAII